MTNRDLGPDPTSDQEVVTRGYGDSRYRRSADAIKFPWDSEAVVFPATIARANGYGDLPGGVMVPRAITLTEIIFRTAGVGVAVGGSGNLSLSVYIGTVDAIGTLIGTVGMPAGTSSFVAAATAVLNKNAVIRTLVTIDATTGNGLHVHYRGIDT